MFSGAWPAAAKKNWMNTRMTFDSRAPHRPLLLPLIAHENVFFMDFLGLCMHYSEGADAAQTSQVLCEMAGLCSRVGGLRPQKRIG